MKVASSSYNVEAESHLKVGKGIANEGQNEEIVENDGIITHQRFW